MSENIYTRVNQDLNGKQSRKVAHNTYLQRRDPESIALKYHATDIVIYHSDGRVVLDTDGWKTSTTKLRYNESYSRLPIRIYSDKGVWYVVLNNNRDGAVTFEDGLTLQPNGDGRYHILLETCGIDPKKMLKLRRKVQAYSKGFIEALRTGNVPAPSLGDCLYCAARTMNGNVPMGEAQKDKSHIESHIAEKYYVPSLLVRACEVMPCSQAMKWAIGEKWQVSKSDVQQTFEKIDAGWGQHDFVWNSLAKMLAKYVLRQLGQTS